MDAELRADIPLETLRLRGCESYVQVLHLRQVVVEHPREVMSNLQEGDYDRGTKFLKYVRLPEETVE